MTGLDAADALVAATRAHRVEPAAEPRVEALKLAVAANLPVLIWGAPGIGKSATSQQLAAGLGGPAGPPRVRPDLLRRAVIRATGAPGAKEAAAPRSLLGTTGAGETPSRRAGSATGGRPKSSLPRPSGLHACVTIPND